MKYKKHFVKIKKYIIKELYYLNNVTNKWWSYWAFSRKSLYVFDPPGYPQKLFTNPGCPQNCSYPLDNPP